jgi:hypothetical protein
MARVGECPSGITLLRCSKFLNSRAVKGLIEDTDGMCHEEGIYEKYSSRCHNLWAGT